ncbi:MAG: MerR family DNA-binding transcriptional regulator [Pacificibacter sp.]|uniref:MerR family transcriptional regulator n=1 Tax=Pacificibacter sp. TaxID=1917866 RepID=UPI00321A9A06
MTTKVMTIRQMCDAYDVTPRTLRFYEAKELLFPIREGQRRLFTGRDRARLKLILRGKRFGFSLERIRQVLDLYDTENGSEKQLRGTLVAYQERKADLKRQVEDLQQVLVELEEHMSFVRNALEENVA